VLACIEDSLLHQQQSSQVSPHAFVQSLDLLISSSTKYVLKSMHFLPAFYYAY
jgi:hypothetical protein